MVESDQGEVDVRLLDVNAPESDECFHRESLNYMTERLKGRTVTLDTDQDVDQFGRVLAYVWDQNQNVNLDMVQRGLAIATTPDTGVGFLIEEEEAFAAGIGLWAHDACGSGPIPNVRVLAVDQYGETVVIRNDETTTVDLSQWTIRDESSRHRYSISRGTELEPGASLTIRSDDPEWDPGSGPIWNNDGDMALLLDASGRVVDRWRY